MNEPAACCGLREGLANSPDWRLLQRFGELACLSNCVYTTEIVWRYYQVPKHLYLTVVF